MWRERAPWVRKSAYRRSRSAPCGLKSSGLSQTSRGARRLVAVEPRRLAPAMKPNAVRPSRPVVGIGDADRAAAVVATVLQDGKGIVIERGGQRGGRGAPFSPVDPVDLLTGACIPVSHLRLFARPPLCNCTAAQK